MADPLDLDLLNSLGPTPSAKKDKPPKLTPEERTTTSPRKGRRPADLAQIEDGLTQAFTFVGMGLSMVNLYDALVIQENAEKLAQVWTKVAEQNPKVKAYLLNAMKGGTWAGAISVSVAVTIPILANHGYVPDELTNMAGTIIKVPDAEMKEAYDKMRLEASSNGDGSAT